MATRESIVCALDGGQATVHLARVAADLPRVAVAPLTLVHVLGAMPDADWDAERQGRPYCLRDEGLEAEGEHVTGLARDQLPRPDGTRGARRRIRAIRQLDVERSPPREDPHAKQR